MAGLVISIVDVTMETIVINKHGIRNPIGFIFRIRVYVEFIY